MFDPSHPKRVVKLFLVFAAHQGIELWAHWGDPLAIDASAATAIAAVLDPGACAFNIFGSAAPLVVDPSLNLPVPRGANLLAADARFVGHVLDIVVQRYAQLQVVGLRVALEPRVHEQKAARRAQRRYERVLEIVE